MAGMIRDRFPTIRQGIDTEAGWPSSPFIDALAQLRDGPPSRTVGNVSYTVLSPDHVVESTLEIKKSVFLTAVTRVETEEQAREFIEQRRRANRTARHHVSAFVLDPLRTTQRSSDDGEPAGTAGVPTLEALTKFVAPQLGSDGPADLSDVVAVTTRWFGGVKLGAGGLVRAYSDAISRALGQAQLLRRRQVDLYELSIDLASVGWQEAALRNAGVSVVDITYQADAALLTLAVAATPDSRTACEQEVSGILSQQVRCEPAGSQWHDHQF